MKRYILGGHALTVLFSINTLQKLATLEAAMREVAERGGKIFEIPYLLVGGEVTWAAIGEAAKRAGIEEVAICHFFPVNPDGSSGCGDPLGDAGEVERALKTIDDIIAAIQIIRQRGIIVRSIDGPTHTCLGKEYLLDDATVESRLVYFLRAAGEKCLAAGLTLAVEPLRRHEDKVIAGTAKMVRILTLVNHLAVRLHFDVFHSVENGEDPAAAILAAKAWIVYLHLHGDKRIAPGADGDSRDWRAIVDAVKQICTAGVKDIPVIPEPFGTDTRSECPPLGEGLPPTPALAEYLDVAYPTLIEAGLQLAA